MITVCYGEVNDYTWMRAKQEAPTLNTKQRERKNHQAMVGNKQCGSSSNDSSVGFYGEQ